MTPLCPQCVNCTSAADNMTEPGTKCIRSAGFYNLDTLLLDHQACEYLVKIFFTTIKKQWKSEFTVLFYSSHQRTCFIFAVTPLTLRLFHFVEQRNTYLSVIKEKSFFRVSEKSIYWVRWLRGT